MLLHSKNKVALQGEHFRTQSLSLTSYTVETHTKCGLALPWCDPQDYKFKRSILCCKDKLFFPYSLLNECVVNKTIMKAGTWTSWIVRHVIFFMVSSKNATFLCLIGPQRGGYCCILPSWREEGADTSGSHLFGKLLGLLCWTLSTLNAFQKSSQAHTEVSSPKL